MDLTSPTLDPPVLRCAGRISAALDEVADLDPDYMGPTAKARALRELSRLEERLHELRLRVLAGAQDVALVAGARSPGAWLAHETRCGRARAKAMERLAEALTERYPRVRAALAGGTVDRAQARVIVAALDVLPPSLDEKRREEAEAHLVAQAAHFEAQRLRVLGRGLLEVVAPGMLDEEERRRLEAEQREARRQTRLTMHVRGDGCTDISIRVPDHVASRLKVYLESLTSPRREHGAVLDDVARVPYPQRLGQAFCALLERLPAKLLPQHGGTATTVMVTIPIDQLLSEIGAAGLGTGERITAAQARRLACTAGLLPVVLGADSEILDLGRARRLFSPAQRRALAVRDGRCRAEGCSIPAAWCEAHHRTPWATGGRTDLADGMLLCSWHHHRAHDVAYDADSLPNGEVRFARRT